VKDKNIIQREIIFFTNNKTKRCQHRRMCFETIKRFGFDCSNIRNHIICKKVMKTQRDADLSKMFVSIVSEIPFN
jgi:hypothetical protein